MTLLYDTSNGNLTDENGRPVYPFGMWTNVDEVVDFLVFNGLDDYEVVEI